MIEINYWAVIVAAVAAFIVGAAWYGPILFGKKYIALRGMNPDVIKDMKPPVWELLGEFVRNLVIAYVLARFALQNEAINWMSAVQTGFWIWIGFQATLLMGSLLHEKMPFKLYIIHAGDALVKTLLMAVIIGMWHY